ncbi:GNAT family N-acetyltransferase [Eremococcus coleocola]|uniref:Acetyltransferase, GNAT family n=1 Tax=Eremococcus coleocola ACS-139-V-Col8 TaxID=908337 RepID=E4KNQ1_9LACT|nr:GNAT family protein [Eremococcus coleocola]EFR31418.1 acetyltransferase, GNAT family [Eremococcus coleocola ACS-139-V-Col8]
MLKNEDNQAEIKTEELETIIREPRLSDAKAIIGLLRHVSRETNFIMFDPGMTLDREKTLIQQYLNSDRDLFLVIEVDDQLVGLANLISLNHSRQAHVAEIGMAIIKEYWGYGMGSVFMEELILFAEENNIKVLNLEVMANNQRAIKLYKRYGFQQVGRLSKRIQIDHVFYDTLLMEKII